VNETKADEAKDRRSGERRMGGAPQPPPGEERRKTDRRGLEGKPEADT
jgi:hypothetical protein